LLHPMFPIAKHKPIHISYLGFKIIGRNSIWQPWKGSIKQGWPLCDFPKNYLCLSAVENWKSDTNYFSVINYRWILMKMSKNTGSDWFFCL
jgi:hypothetical protein